MRLVEALLNALRTRGAGEIFGIPGDFALPMFKVIEESAVLPLYTLSHEPAVGFAADASARFRGGLGVAAVTYGAGAFNLVNSIAGAYAEKSPVVAISGAPGRLESASGLLLHHQGPSLDSQFNIYREITCAQARLDDAATAPFEIARVLRAALEQTRPVYLEVPRDMVLAEVEPVPDLPSSPADPEAVAACADEVMRRLGEAERPVMLVDVEVRRFGLEAEVAELARRLRLPVATTFMGRGLLTGAEAPLIGTYLGVAGEPLVSERVEGSDCLLLLGVILSDTNFGVSARRLDLRRTIHAGDRAVTLGFHRYPDLPLADLVAALLARGAPLGSGAGAIAAAAYPGGLVADHAPIAPSDVARAVNDLFARHGRMPIASDIGDCLFTAMEIEETDLTAPGYYAGMGYGVPAGIGAQLATGRRVLILVGDGAFQMTGMELGNCTRLAIDPIVVVFNNASWEMLRAFQPESRFNDLDSWSIAELARAMGGDGRRVATRAGLEAALARAAGTRGRFQLVEVMLARGSISATLGRFVEGVKRLHAPAS